MTHARLRVRVCATAPRARVCLFLRVRVCARVILFASPVNYLESWQCLSIVDGSGKYVSLGQLFGGNSFQHLSALKIKKVVVVGGGGDSSHACHAFKRLLLPRACGGGGGGG